MNRVVNLLPPFNVRFVSLVCLALAMAVTMACESGAVSPVAPSTTGASVANSAQLLASPEFESMLKTASEEYDLVLVDTPPLNVVTDAASVAASVDAVIVVVREGMTEQSALELTLDRLQRAGARPAGLVLNDTELPPHYKAYSHAD